MEATIGVHVYEEPEKLRDTLPYLRRKTDPIHQLLLIEDAPDEVSRGSLGT